VGNDVIPRYHFTKLIFRRCMTKCARMHF